MNVVAADGFRDLVERSLDGFVVQSEGRIVFANRAARIILGADDVLGRSISDFLDPPYLTVLTAEIVDPGSTRSPFAECPLRRGDGTQIAVELSAVPLVFENRASVQLILRDVDERVKARNDTIRTLSTARLEATSLLAGGVAHEINNVLAIIRGHTSLLELETLSAAECAKRARRIAEATERAAEITRNLLAFAMHGVHIPTRIGPADLVAEVVEAVALSAPPHVTIETDFSDPIFDLFGDGPALRRALMGVCLNAIDAMPRGGKIVIAVAGVEPQGQYGAQVRIEVSDTGTGMTEAESKRAFEPFYSSRADNRRAGLGA